MHPIRLILFTILAFSAHGQGVVIEWDAPQPPAACRIHVGTQSRVYLTNYVASGTVATLLPNQLFTGTNYVAVSVYDVTSQTNVTISDLSNEMIVIKRPTRVLRLQTSTNLTHWSDTPHAIQLADGHTAFYRLRASHSEFLSATANPQPN